MTFEGRVAAALVVLASTISTEARAEGAVELWSQKKIEAECSQPAYSDQISRGTCISLAVSETNAAGKALAGIDTNRQPFNRFLHYCAAIEKSSTGRARCVSNNIYDVSDMARFYREGVSTSHLPSPSEQAMIQKVVGARLKDPFSAQYQFGLYNGTTLYCAEINAKNSYGGYTGFKRFAVGIVADSLGIVPTDYVNLSDRADYVCGAAGY
jgi:hypothetical protein